MGEIIELLLAFSESIGHLGVLLLMAIESSFIPFPSEIVVPPAAYLAYQGEMNIWLVIVAGISGSLIGATINYFIARSLGRVVVYGIAKRKFMRYLLITHHKIEKAEKYFVKYGGISTFIARLIPGIRQLISLPAGFSKMNYWSFLFYTFLGSGMWVSILAVQGYLLGEHEEFVRDYWREISFTVGVLIVAVALVVWYFTRKKK